MIYFIQQGDDGPIKVGTASSPEQRLNTLQTGSPQKLRLIHTEPGGSGKEKRFHEALEELNLRGEWFQPSANFWATVKKLSQSYGWVETEQWKGERFPVLWFDYEREKSEPCPFCGGLHIHGRPNQVREGQRCVHCNPPSQEEGCENEFGNYVWTVSDEQGRTYYSNHGYWLKTYNIP